MDPRSDVRNACGIHLHHLPSDGLTDDLQVLKRVIAKEVLGDRVVA